MFFNPNRKHFGFVDIVLMRTNFEIMLAFIVGLLYGAILGINIIIAFAMR